MNFAKDELERFRLVLARFHTKAGLLIMCTAARDGDLGTVKWTHEIDQWYSGVILAAVMSGQLEVMKWAIKIDPSWGNWAVELAATYGKWHVVEWLLKEGYQWKDSYLLLASDNGHEIPEPLFAR